MRTPVPNMVTRSHPCFPRGRVQAACRANTEPMEGHWQTSPPPRAIAGRIHILSALGKEGTFRHALGKKNVASNEEDSASIR